jgi:myo-inositol 2-dehydrogenase/D-chiro-inositol 1-dehydrogenase
MTDNSSVTRRDFIKTSGVVAVGTALGTNFAYAAGSDEIKVGVIGVGGRGTGAIVNVLNADPGVRIVAIGDAFKDRVTGSLERLKKQTASDPKLAARVDIPESRAFVGLDAYEKVIASEANYIILASPPAFRPQHLKSAVAAGKHIFTEKPVAVDGPGIRSVLQTYEDAKAKKLGIGAGTQRRHQTGYLETMKRVKDGAIGNIVAARAYWNQGGLWVKPREAEWTDVEWQMRNWLYFTWLSGDHIVEQHVHNIDVVNWAMDAHPVRATAVGGRQERTEPAYGHIYDHFAVDYEYENGVHMMSMCRQWRNTAGKVAEALVGEKGTVDMAANRTYEIKGPNAWKFEGKDNEPYQQEHTDLIASIRTGDPYNELKHVAESTLTAIMGRQAAYTGQVLTWDQILNSPEALVPEKLTFGPMATPPVPVPGQTRATNSAGA